MEINNPQVKTYLETFDTEARVLPLESRSALRKSLVEHINDSLATNQSDAHVDQTLKDLGDPREIVANEAQHPGAVDNPPDAKTIAGGIGLIILAVLGVVLTIFSLIGLLWVIITWPGPTWLIIASIIFVILGSAITVMSLRRRKKNGW